MTNVTIYYTPAGAYLCFPSTDARDTFVNSVQSNTLFVDVDTYNGLPALCFRAK